jgi:hypothetical protein
VTARRMGETGDRTSHSTGTSQPASFLEARANEQVHRHERTSSFHKHELTRQANGGSTPTVDRLGTDFPSARPLGYVAVVVIVVLGGDSFTFVNAASTYLPDPAGPWLKIVQSRNEPSALSSVEPVLTPPSAGEDRNL